MLILIIILIYFTKTNLFGHGDLLYPYRCSILQGLSVAFIDFSFRVTLNGSEQGGLSLNF